MSSVTKHYILRRRAYVIYRNCTTVHLRHNHSGRPRVASHVPPDESVISSSAGF